MVVISSLFTAFLAVVSFLDGDWGTRYRKGHKRKQDSLQTGFPFQQLGV